MGQQVASLRMPTPTKGNRRARGTGTVRHRRQRGAAVAERPGQRGAPPPEAIRGTKTEVEAVLPERDRTLARGHVATDPKQTVGQWLRLWVTTTRLKTSALSLSRPRAASWSIS